MFYPINSIEKTNVYGLNKAIQIVLKRILHLWTIVKVSYLRYVPQPLVISYKMEDIYTSLSAAIKSKFTMNSRADITIQYTKCENNKTINHVRSLIDSILMYSKPINNVEQKYA